MSTSAEGSSISRHLRATKKILQDVAFDTKYVHGGEIRHIRGLRYMRLCRIVATLGKAEVGQTKWDGWIVTDVRNVLAQRPRARRYRDSPPHSVLDERACANQPDPPRSPHSYSGLLGRARQRRRCHRVDPRMPGLEGDLHFTLLLVDRIPLPGCGQNLCLPRTFKVLPPQLADRPGGQPTSPRSPPPGNPPGHQSAKIRLC